MESVMGADAFNPVACLMAHMGNIHNRHRIVCKHNQTCVARQCLHHPFCKQGRQRAFQSAEIERLIHGRLVSIS